MALSHVMVKKCFLCLDVFRMPWFGEEVRLAVQKASIGGEATASHTQNQAIQALERKKKKKTIPRPLLPMILMLKETCCGLNDSVSSSGIFQSFL